MGTIKAKLLKNLLVVLGAYFIFPMGGNGQTRVTELKRLSDFNEPSASWKVVSDVGIELKRPNSLIEVKNVEQGVFWNNPTKREPGEDLYTNESFGDLQLELDFMMKEDGNSGIYLQGRYEVQLADSWLVNHMSSESSGGIYGVMSPRVNASKAPGLWQHLTVFFKAPKFDGTGTKTENAKILRVELNGMVVQENVELLGPTAGAVAGDEVSNAPLRIQGDHGAVAFKNIQVTHGLEDYEELTSTADPIWVDYNNTPVLRSFMDISSHTGRHRVVHAISVASSQNLHYTYDLDHGSLIQVWRGGFLDATPMWDGRGNGTSIPLGVVQQLSGAVLNVAQLADINQEWPKDTVATGFKPKGYKLAANNKPVFQYELYGNQIEDRIEVSEGDGVIHRFIQINDNQPGWYALLADSESIVQVDKSTFLVGDKKYYLQINNLKKNKPTIRETSEGRFQLLVEANMEVEYSIIF